jgi:hypothetical protein
MNSFHSYEGPSSLLVFLPKNLNDIWLCEKSPFFDRGLVGPNRSLSASILDQSDATSIRQARKCRLMLKGLTELKELVALLSTSHGLPP